MQKQIWMSCFQDFLQDPGSSPPSMASSCLFTSNFCIHNVVRHWFSWFGAYLFVVCRFVLSLQKSFIYCGFNSLSTIHMDNIHYVFPIQKFSFLLHFCGSVCFLLRVGEYKETFIFLKLFLLFSSPCPQDSLPHVHLRFVARHFHVQIVMILQPYKAK